MKHRMQLISTSVAQALQELRVNRLRTFLSLLGITIGIFCIIAVLTVIDSMKANIQKEVASLGSNVMYINRWPWIPEQTEYKWWEYWRRPSMSMNELRAVEADVPGAQVASLCFSVQAQVIKRRDQELTGISIYAVTQGFDKLQNIEIEKGRYLSPPEIDGGNKVVVIGSEVYKGLFPGQVDPLGSHISLKGTSFTVVGVLKKLGKNMAGFDFDQGLIFPYYAATSLYDVKSLQYDPLLIIKARRGVGLQELKYQVEGALRRVRKIRPGTANDFAVNQLSQVTAQLDIMFGTINIVGWVIAGFSLLVGGFGIANIMFVTVKERTKMIGLKKAIGARRGSILMEFLVEAVTLCLTGGILGIIIVLLLTLVMTYGFDFPTTLSLKNFFIGLSISAVVGVLAGYIPARSAARLNAVVAIRSN